MGKVGIHPSSVLLQTLFLIQYSVLSHQFGESESEVAQSCPTLCDPMDCSLSGSSIHGIFPGKSTGVGCHFLLQWIFPTQESNLGLPHCRQMLYRLSHQGSPMSYEVSVIQHLQKDSGTEEDVGYREKESVSHLVMFNSL